MYIHIYIYTCLYICMHTQTTIDEANWKKKENATALSAKKRSTALAAELALNVPSDIRAQSQALEVHM